MKYVKLVPIVLIVAMFAIWSLANDAKVSAGISTRFANYHSGLYGARSVDCLREVSQHLPIDEIAPVIDRPMYRTSQFRNASYVQNYYPQQYQCQQPTSYCQQSCNSSCYSGWYPGKWLGWRWPIFRAWRAWRCR